MAALEAQPHGWRPVLEIVLPLAAGIAGFAVTALAAAAARARVPEALFTVLLLVVIVVLARGAGILFALPVGVAAVLAFDWYFLPPLRALDANTVLVLGTFLIMSVIVAEATTRASRRAISSERARGALAAEQKALRRVATLVAQQARPEEVFAAVTAEVGRVLSADQTTMSRYDADGTAIVVGTWSTTGAAVPIPVGLRLERGGRNVHTLVLQTGQPARIDDYAGPTADAGREQGIRSTVGAPITVEGRLWGVMFVASTREGLLPPDIEGRLAAFTELAGTAIANTEARQEVREFADEQASLRRVATLVARAAPPEEVFAAVTAEVGRVLSADFTSMSRYDPDGRITVVGLWTKTDVPAPFSVGTRLSIGGRNVTTLVFETGRPTWIDYSGDASGPVADAAREWGFRSAVGAPISLEGRLWGVITVSTADEEPLEADTEARLAGFTELVATAIANAEAHEALTASRARIVASADAARRRIERDLHDAAQQRLVSLALHVRTTLRDAVPPEADKLTAQLDGVATEIVSVVDELRELARGLHPAALAEGGLRPALKTLARRSAVPVRLDIEVVGRLPDPIELATYYMVAEALTNTVKHAHATVIDVDAAVADGVLRVRVRDDGRGGADPVGGTGLVGLMDRIEALGGRLTVDSRPGAGTTMQAVLPLTTPPRTRPSD